MHHHHYHHHLLLREGFKLTHALPSYGPRHPTETAMGYKSGESRSLMEQKERETKMVLPNPPPLGTLGPILQVS